MGWLCESLGCLVRWGGGTGPQQLCCCLIYIFELSEVLFEIGLYGPPYFEIYNFTMTLSCLPPVWGAVPGRDRQKCTGFHPVGENCSEARFDLGIEQ